MSYLEALLTAEAHQQGRAQRSALFRHRHLTKRPLGLILWQLGAEPFTAASIAWGFEADCYEIAVPGEPRDRELAFRALLVFGKAFNRWLEVGHGHEHPQIVVPNRGTLALMERLGRRLSYLPTDGPHAAAPELVRFGRHLKFFTDRARYPGQQLVVVLTDLLASHWVTGLSELEQQNLPALDAAIDPPKGMTAHGAAREAERIEIGPTPGAEDDEAVDDLIVQFNLQRGKDSSGKPQTHEAVVAKLRAPIERHYRRLTDRGWPLLWRCLERERGVRAAPSVERRWKEDCEALDRHLEWTVAKGGRYRTRQTNRQAAFTLHRWEEAHRLVTAEEALDDPLRMVPDLLNNQAILGRVVDVDLEHREKAKVKQVARPLITIETFEPCTIPIGKELYWTKDAGGAAYVVQNVSAVAGASKSRVTLKHVTSSRVDRPAIGDEVIFSIHHLGSSPPLRLQDRPPWTHSGPPIPEGRTIEAPESEAWE